MVSITSYSTISSSVSSTTQAQSTQQTANTSSTTQTDETSSSSTSSVSTLASQLAAAAERAEVRDATLSQKELAQKAKSLLNQITGMGYYNSRAASDEEVPDTDNEELLARAEQATNFVNGKGSNPFKGLSSEQLTLIIYDDSGTFTTNERRAAFSADYDLKEMWNQKVVAQANIEQATTGNSTNFYKACLDYYNNEPLIKQVQYEDDYATNLQKRIDQSESSSTTDNSLSQQLERLLEWRLSASEETENAAQRNDS